MAALSLSCLSILPTRILRNPFQSPFRLLMSNSLKGIIPSDSIASRRAAIFSRIFSASLAESFSRNLTASLLRKSSMFDPSGHVDKLGFGIVSRHTKFFLNLLHFFVADSRNQNLAKLQAFFSEHFSDTFFDELLQFKGFQRISSC